MIRIYEGFLLELFSPAFLKENRIKLLNYHLSFQAYWFGSIKHGAPSRSALIFDEFMLKAAKAHAQHN